MQITLRSDATEEQLTLLVELLGEIRDIPGDVAEIGSWKCGTSMVIGLNLPLKTIYAFDIFGGLPYGKERGFEFFSDPGWEEVVALAEQFPNLVPVRGMHEETVPEFAKRGEPLALIFMDSDHYESHVVSLQHLCPLLAKGGLIVFHDWHFAEVQKAVWETISAGEYEMLEGRDLFGMGVLRKK